MPCTNLGNSDVVGLCISNQKLTGLSTVSKTKRLYGHDLVTKKNTSWSHADSSSCWGSRMAIIRNQIVVADVFNRRLTIYGVGGQLIKHVDCPQISSNPNPNWICVTSSPTQSDVIIISSYDASQVFAVNLTAGAVIWTNSGIRKPQGIANYGSDYVLVTNASFQTQLWTLDAKTG